MRARNIFNATAAILAVLIPVTLTLFLWDRERARAELEAKVEFEFRARETTSALQARILAYEQVLRGAAGLFAVADKVTREEWREYVRQLHVSTSYPGITAIAYVPIVAAEQIDVFVSDVRKIDQASYEIWPKGDRRFLAPTLYIEPSTDHNLRALGFDLYSDPIRLTALEFARDTGGPALTARITLAQDLGETERAGFVIYVPVYRRGTEPLTVEQRRTTLIGFVGGGVRANDLLDRVLGTRFNLDLEIFDGSVDANAPPIAQRRPPNARPQVKARFTAANHIDFNNRTWTLNFASTPEFELTVDQDKPRLVLIGGLLLSAGFIALLWSLASTRKRAVMLARNMTAELRARQIALRESEERLTLALQGSELALFDWDVGTGVVQLSDRWAAMLGGTPQPTTTTITELSRLVHPEDAPRLQVELQKALRGETEFYRVEHRVKTQDGAWIWILSRAKVTQRDAGGLALRVTGTNTDITDRKTVEAVKDDFISTVNHELRTPLTVIVASLALLKENLKGLAPDDSMMLDMACQNSARLQAMVNNVLDIEKIASDLMQFDIKPVEIGPFLKRALDLNRMFAEQFKVRFELHGPVPPAAVMADPERLMQVVTNLLSNAAKFSPPGDVVIIAVQIRDSEMIRISITDHGPGVPLQFRDRIFQRFAQADASNTRKQGGTGLGLSICKLIVQKLNGSIGYESEPGQGATFYIELPLGRDAPGESPVEPEPAQ